MSLSPVYTTMICKRPDGVLVDVYPDQNGDGYFPGVFDSKQKRLFTVSNHKCISITQTRRGAAK